ncbi:hypothetical protein DYL61_19105 [Pseudomonas nabeulensis]|uniref:Uncharacterized protein n=1 Tax=Pseudomonas nabeulensis TaxID=2293833 RepID=A0A4Z0AXT3_9PSED|nr:hypothetical protein DYL61_19105 [Pseudomonas nabeulensis]
MIMAPPLCLNSFTLPKPRGPTLENSYLGIIVMLPRANTQTNVASPIFAFLTSDWIKEELRICLSRLSTFPAQTDFH